MTNREQLEHTAAAWNTDHAPRLANALREALENWGDDDCTCSDCWSCAARSALDAYELPLCQGRHGEFPGD